jgi:hypothetical protein
VGNIIFAYRGGEINDAEYGRLFGGGFDGGAIVVIIIIIIIIEARSILKSAPNLFQQINK